MYECFKLTLKTGEFIERKQYKMKNIPVYFPMTYLSAPVESMLAACFRQIVVYRPSDRTLPEQMQAAVDSGRLAVRIPVEKENERLLGLMDAYYSWAEENRGRDLAFFKGAQSGIPYFGDTSISGIRQKIREISSESEKNESADPIFEARLFLEMAQALDRQNSELERSLDDLSVKEESMLDALLGNGQKDRDIAPVKRSGSPADPGGYMTAGRIQAWWKLAREDPEPCNLLVTESRAVIEYLIETGSGLEKTGVVDSVPIRPVNGRDFSVWRERFLGYLLQLVSTPDTKAGVPDIPAAVPGESAVTVSVYRSEAGAGVFFNSFSDLDAGVPDPGPGERLVICLVEKADG